MALIDQVKKRLRIKHNSLNDDIQANIDAAKKEMIRNGILEAKANDETDPLIVQAVKTYCQANFTDNTSDMEKYFASWQYQLDCIRKTEAYTKEAENV